MTFYDQHLFVCLHQRAEPKASCGGRGAASLHAYAKARVKALGLPARRLRLNQAGCLNRCALGPVMVVYPEGIWYRIESHADIDEIIEQHVQGGQVVSRLQLEDSSVCIKT